MLKKFFAALAVMIFIFSATPPTTFANQEFVISDTLTTVPVPFEADKFSGSVITVTGSAVGPKNAIVGSNFYKSFARQAAKIDALEQLVESIQCTLTSADEAKVEIEVEFDEKLWDKYFSKIEIVEIKFVDNGEVCEVTLKGTLK